MVLGYVAAGTSVRAQVGRFPPVSGQTVMVHLDPNAGGFTCAVVDVRGDFIGCKGTGRQEGAGDWYNLRGVGRIHLLGN